MHLFDQNWWFWLIFWANWDGLDLTRCQKPPQNFFDPQGGQGGKYTGGSRGATHSQMEHYFFSYLLTWEVDLIEILKIMAQMWQYVIFLSLKPTKVASDFILY